MTHEQANSKLMVSIVVPTYNAGDSIAGTLDALVAQSHPSDVAFEVVVADDGSDDDTVSLARSFGSPIRVLEGERSGPGAARNRGAAASLGDILVFVDSDDRPLAGWLEALADLFSDPRVAIGTWPALAHDVGADTETTMTPDQFAAGGVLSLAGCFAMRTSLFEDVGGYDPVLRFGENTDLSKRVSARCAELGYTIASHTRQTIELAFNQSPAHYDRHRLEALEYLFERDADKYASRPRLRSRHLAIAAVNAARCEEWSTARRYALNSVTSWPRNLRAYPRLVLVMIPPVGRRVWSADSRRKRLTSAESRERVGDDQLDQQQEGRCGTGRWVNRRVRSQLLHLKRIAHPRWIGVRRWLIDRVWNEGRQDRVVDDTSNPGIAIVESPAEIEPYWGYVVHGRLGVIDRSAAGAMQHVRDPEQRFIYRGLPSITHLLHRDKRVRVRGMPLSLRNPWGGNYYHATIECLGAAARFDEAGLLEDNTLVIGRDLAETGLWKDFVSAGGLEAVDVVIQSDAWVTGSGRVAFPDFNLVSGVQIANLAPFGVVNVNADSLVRTLKFLENVLPDRIQEPDLRLFVLRGSGNGRMLRNEAELAEHLAHWGFRSVDPGALSWVEQVQLFRRASCVVGVHGAALTNIIYRFPDSLKLIEVAEPGYRADHFRNIAKELTYDHRSVDGEMASGVGPRQSFNVDLAAIDQALGDWGL